MKKYTFKDQTYLSFWELNRATPELVLARTPHASFWRSFGITVEEMPDPEPTPEEKAQEELEAKIADIDHKTSALIRDGFDYEIEGETLHFSYDMFDQQGISPIRRTPVCWQRAAFPACRNPLPGTAIRRTVAWSD